MNNMNELCEKYYWLIDEAVNDPNETRVTIKGILAKFASEVAEPEVKPRTKVAYVKVEDEDFFDLKGGFRAKGIYFNDSVTKEPEYKTVMDIKELAHNFLIKNLYNCIEVEMTWQDEVKSSVDAIALNCTIAHMIDFAPEKIIEISHKVASLTDKPKG